MVGGEGAVVQGLGCLEVLAETRQELLGPGRIRLSGLDVTEGQEDHAPTIEGAALPKLCRPACGSHSPLGSGPRAPRCSATGVKNTGTAPMEQSRQLSSRSQLDRLLEAVQGPRSATGDEEHHSERWRDVALPL